MAAEVPVTDILCEAMEYLTKLGSNLRTRSERLKVKRISKEKLLNAHAVQKAANKVLLICELSKKSLENVESGIRKILSHVDASQAANDGGKILKTREDVTSKSDFRYFTYQSRRLKISKTKRVPLKHFLSAKVLAMSLPVSMQNKYPVYYDCKLYRTRKRKHALANLSSDKTNENISLDDKSESLHNENETCENKLKEKTKCWRDCNYDAECKLNEIENKDSNVKDTKSRTGCTEFNDDDSKSSINEIRKKSESHEVLALEKSNNEIIEKEISNKDVLLEESKKIDDDLTEKKSSNNSVKHNISRDSDNDSKLKSSSSKEQDIKKCQKRKLNKLQIIDDSSNSSNELDQDKVSEKYIENKNIDHDFKVSDSETNITTHHKSKKRKIIDSDSETENIKHEPGISDDNTADKEKQDDDLSQESKSEHKKPLIKCVNITKLLKPDVLQSKNGSDSSLINKSRYCKTKSEIKSTGLKPSKDSMINYDLIREARKNSEQVYWEKKRKEVSGFIPKSFVINITRLPKLSENFLRAHNLKVITQKGSVLCKVSNETDNISDVNTIIANGKNNSEECSLISQTKSNDDEAKQNEDIDKVKNALLNDSDSDDKVSNSDSNKELSAEAEKVKNALLNDSDSDKNEIFDLDENVTLNIKSQHNNGSKKSEKISKDTEKVKDALLKVTDSDNRNEVLDSAQKKGLESIENNTENLDNNSLVNTDLQPNNSVLNEMSERQHIDSASVDSENQSKVCENANKTEKYVDNDNKTNNINCNIENEPKATVVTDKEVTPTKLKKNRSSQSSDDIPGTPLSQRKIRKQSLTPQSKRKHIMESMYAKKMLLTYSSSSDTEDEQLKEALKGIKKSLLGVSSDEEIGLGKKIKQRRQRVSSSTSSSSDISRKVKNKDTHNSTPNSSDSEKRNKKNRESSEKDSNEKLKGNDGIEQIDGNMDEQSNSSSSKMVRSKAKPGNCSSQNSDNQDTSDKDIDGLTNLNKLNTSHRRRVSTSSDKTSNSNSRKKTGPKTSLIGEELLQSESSDAASLADSDGVLEELPPVSIQKLNGSGIEQLGKDELLGESDSSISHNEKDKSSEEYQKEDETDEESVKLKRRKGNAISSDSEAGSSRKKLEKVSDFEDSEDEGSETIKKKRKKKASDSDASAGSSSNDGSKKKRRRIKQVNDESEGSGSDSETEGRNKHGRKNIRKVMGKNQLEEATKKAAREEKERIARITERQKLYNNLEFDETGKPDEVVLEKVVLDFDPETKDPLIEVDRGLVKKLKPHQANGIKFMWDACFESVKRIKKDKGSGCILAHCMGLGKTLQVVSLTHTLLIHSALTNVNRVLVVCPLSTVLNWVNEYRMWLKHSETDYEVDVYELSRYKQNSERAYQLQSWLSGGGVCVLGYEMFRNLSADNNKKYKKKMLRSFQESLVDPGPDLVVCDEGHLLKNEKTSLSQSMNRVKTRRRIVLTGTPLQNNLKEYYCMVQFVKPNLLGKYNEYLNRFVNPITNGQYTDSTEHDIRIMKRRSHVLHKMLDGAVQRRDYGVLAPFLPPKHEYVLFITLAEVQIKLYHFYLANYSRRPLPGRGSGFLFPDFQSLQRIWTHPLVLKHNSERYEIMQQKKREREEEDSEGSLVDFIDDDDSTPDESSTEESSDDLSDASDDSRKKSHKKKSAKKGKNKDPKFTVKRGTRANPVEMDDDVREVDEVTAEVKNENPTEWWIKLVTDEEIEDMRNSHKLVLLFDILRQCEAIGDKLLVFSQSLYSLDLIEHFLGKVDEATQEGRIDEKLGGHVGSWSPGVDYFRLDGSTSCENRSIWCKNFNREDNPRARLFLISTRAGGLGINLVAANRVVIFDVSWNPSHDVQSIFRVYRFGQKKPCYVYRFLAMGTMEEKIYERQVTKQAISKRVIDEQQIDRHYAENDLAELYTFEPTPPQPRPLPPLPKDRLFAEMLREHEVQIYKYHEHDSLLENKEEETLSEEERKAAWEDFENEKNKPPPAPFPSPWPMHNGMVPGLLAQQQQLAYAALAAMLRKDMPGMNDNQIRDMLPLIYNSNPGLMQKMGEIYKYSQQSSMMNPAMMNSVMNPSSAGGAGAGPGGAMSGSSGLQYEPPWQRQHQQQQQIRLQQLMQQQNQMGAKFYSGGLGSRDPVAMALQQQRAREIMLGGGGAGAGGAGAGAGSAAPAGGASRPRGRPPLQPRAPVPVPSPHSNDVVNLDSD